MFHNLAEDITFVLIKHKILDIEQRDVYIYGLEVILLNSIVLITFMLMSFLFKEWLHYLAFLVTFVPLRIFSGGYHADTSERCFLVSVFMYGASLAAIKLIQNLSMNWFFLAAGVISVIVILVMTPLINKNNPLSVSQKNRNRITAYAILVLDLILFILCCSKHWKFASSELIFICLVAILLMIGKLKDKLTNSAKKNSKDE